MHDTQILQQSLENQCPNIHKKRVISLVLATKSVLDGADLTLTKLGRNLDTNTTVKHAIKRVDRLLGNSALHREKDDIYKWHCRLITGANPCQIVLVDWSDVREQLRCMTIRASVVLDGRSVTLYEQVFEYKDYNSPRSHQIFLDKLEQIPPSHALPIIVSDAGFRNTWFRQVEAKGWFWLGRVRGEVLLKQKVDLGCLIMPSILRPVKSRAILAAVYYQSLAHWTGKLTSTKQRMRAVKPSGTLEQAKSTLQRTYTRRALKSLGYSRLTSRDTRSTRFR